MQKLKNNEAQPKFTGSYKKKSVCVLISFTFRSLGYVFISSGYEPRRASAVSRVNWCPRHHGFANDHDYEVHQFCVFCFVCKSQPKKSVCFR